jgi:hypothetical protein
MDGMRGRIATLAVGAALVAVAVVMAYSGPPAAADRGGCPNANATVGGEKANWNSAFGAGKQTARGCASAGLTVTATSTPDPSTPIPEPSAEPTPTPTPTPTPPTPTPTRTPEPTAEPTPTPTPPTPTPTPPTPTPTPTPTPAPIEADVRVDFASASAPDGAEAGTSFSLRGGARLVNAGPTASVVVDLTFTVSAPPDCDIVPAGPVVVQDVTLPADTNVFVGRSWTVTCWEAGDHTFTVTAVVAIDPLDPATDPDPANNSASADDHTVIS